MIFDPSSAPHLKPWLVRTLEPICDAEPGALADYILALLKHNVPENEMRKELESQLDEFLETECKPFVETLFTVLRTKSYLPYNPPSPPPSSQNPDTEGIPIPLDALMGGDAGQSSSDRPRKRSFSGDGPDGRPTKGPRLSSDADFSRPGAWNGSSQFGGFGGPGMEGFVMPMGMGMNGMGPMNGRRQQGYQPPGQKRGLCRDYHTRGFCSRGDTCKFSHGEDAVLPSQLYQMGGPGIMPFNYLYNMFNNPGAAGYDPNERMDMRSGSRQRPPVLPRSQQEDPSRVLGLGELPVIQDLTPNVPPEAVNPHPESSSTTQPTSDALQVPSADSIGPVPEGFQGGVFPPNFMGIPMYQNQPMDGVAGPSGPSNFRGRGGHGGRGRGNFGADAFRPGRRGDKTLVVEKIPEDKSSITQINEWFKKFGTVTNVAVDPMGGKALVSFSTHEEARAAWKSEDAVFGNRFVKVFWHRPLEGQGQVGQRALKASAPLVANLSTKEGGDNVPATSTIAPTPSSIAPASSSTSKKLATPSTAAALAAKQELLEKQIAEQKALMESLASATPEEKKEIMARLRKLGEEMSAISSATAPTKKATTPSDPEQKERERLDKELETPAVEGEETTEDLKAKLERLKAEAASLGITDAGAEPAYGGYRGGYRGRGRGRGFYRGGPPIMRGGHPRGSMKLDNRPKTLLVKGVKEADLQAVRDWYETTGQLDSVDVLEGGDVIVSFRSRPAAEQGLAKGTSIPTVGKVQISWHTAKPGEVRTVASVPAAKGTNGTAPAAVNRDVDSVMKSGLEERPLPSPARDDEEIVASGWGAGDDDTDGMGML